MALPPDWQPSEDLRTYAKDHGLSSSEVDRELARFRNHAAQSDRRCSDWDAAFRNWLLKAAEFLGKPPPQDKTNNVAPLGFYAAFGSPELDAWDAHNRATKGINMPRDSKGGWRCVSRWPPGYVEQPLAATG